MTINEITYDDQLSNGTFSGNGNGPSSKNLEKIRLIEKVKHQETNKTTPSDHDSVGSFLELFQFAKTKDVVMMLVGVLCAIINGLLHTLNMVLYSTFVGYFTEQALLQNKLSTVAEFWEVRNVTPRDASIYVDTFRLYCDELNTYTNGSLGCDLLEDGMNVFDKTTMLFFIAIGITLCVFVCGSVKMALFMITAQRQIIRLRLAFYRNVLRQEISWFDDNKTGDLGVKLTEDVNIVHRAIENNVPLITQWFVTALASTLISLIYGWKLSLVMLTMSPVLCAFMFFSNKYQGRANSQEREAYGSAGTVAEEVFSNIRTVVALSGEEKEADRYVDHLKKARGFGVKKGIISGLRLGLQWGDAFFGYALGFYYGGVLVRSGEYSVSQMMTVFYTSFVAAIYIGFVLPAAKDILTAKAALGKIRSIIHKKSTIDSSSTEGLTPQTVSGTIEFKNVTFAYPSRLEVKVLNNLNLTLSKGQTVALVGASGCGKSTVVQLILRFYDPIQGQVCIDGHSIKDLNIKWLRQHIGFVSQEPVLFATTIAENIRYGREDATIEEIIEASKKANAYDFIMALPLQYETYVGEQGAQLSGGQKQRLAIARALVKDPKILLLDEATSALDTESESIVQDALEKASQGRTTIIIAHRLSTIRNADVILAFSGGCVAEQGTHDELMARGGIYTQLVALQSKKNEYFSDSAIRSPNEHSKKVENFKWDMANGSHTPDLNNQKILKYKKAQHVILRLFKLNAPEWFFIMCGLMGGSLSGCMQCIWAFIIGIILEGLSSVDLQTQERTMNFSSLLCVGLAFFVIITNLTQDAMLAVSGESLTTRLRDRLFRATVRQKMSWYDDPKNSVGILTTRLATEASQVQEAFTTTIGHLMNCATIMVLGLAFSFYFSWKLALIFVCAAPIVFVSARGQQSLTLKIKRTSTKSIEIATAGALESISNIRSVASLTIEDKFYEQYASSLEKASHSMNGYLLSAGLCYGFYTSIPYMVNCACYIVGSILIESQELEFYNVLRTITCMSMSAISLFRVLILLPDTTSANYSAEKIFTLIDEAPTIEECRGGTLTIDEDKFKSSVRFSGVHFRYPMRPEQPVLNGLDLQVSPGKTLALVGESGCGKSTTMQLLERFYDCQQGNILLDDKYDIKDLNIPWLRLQIGLVSQEPVLFDRSVSENIAYGDNSRNVNMEEIIQAARAANIHNFIEALPCGYETNVGSKGTQLSGGQKQRIAIARALVRNPKILLLDEATSALDTESEKVVQEALDKARKGRTCIVIAHRLSTITSADTIAVLKKGVIHEIGTHGQLMAKRGLYYQLQMTQTG